jgi:hypothetical protein
LKSAIAADTGRLACALVERLGPRLFVRLAILPRPAGPGRRGRDALARLVERGHILRIDLGQQLFAYLRPGSNLVGDISLMREQILAHQGS